MKVETDDRRLLLQSRTLTVDLNLERFHIRTAFHGKRFCVEIDRDPGPEQYSLAATLRQFSQTKYPAFYTRFLRAVRNLEHDLPSTLINEATAAPTDQMVVLDALSSAPWAAQLAEDDPLVAAKLRGLYRRQELLRAAGGVMTSEQVGELLRLSRQAVDKRRAANQLLALTQGRRGYSYPCFQFDDGKTISGLEVVLNALAAVDPWMQMHFFTTPTEILGGKTPIEILREGKTDAVVSAATTFGEQGAA